MTRFERWLIVGACLICYAWTQYVPYDGKFLCYKYKLATTHSLCLNDSANLTELVKAPSDEILNTHNLLRDQVSPAAKKPLPKLVWNNELAATAERWAAQCPMDHDAGKNRALPGKSWWWVGQNMCFANQVENWTDCINAWSAERSAWVWGVGSSNGSDVGHYTQIVWANTTSIGCAQAHCKGDWEYILVCNYAPGGNIGPKNTNHFAFPYDSFNITGNSTVGNNNATAGNNTANNANGTNSNSNSTAGNSTTNANATAANGTIPNGNATTGNNTAPNGGNATMGNNTAGGNVTAGNNTAPNSNGTLTNGTNVNGTNSNPPVISCMAVSGNLTWGNGTFNNATLDPSTWGNMSWANGTSFANMTSFNFANMSHDFTNMTLPPGFTSFVLSGNQTLGNMSWPNGTMVICMATPSPSQPNSGNATTNGTNTNCTGNYVQRRGPQCRHGLTAPSIMCLNDSPDLVALLCVSSDVILERHNYYRSQSNLSPQAKAPLPKLQWDDDLALQAERKAAQCVMQHSDHDALAIVGKGTTFSYVNENLGSQTGGNDMPERDIIELWAKEKAWWQYGVGKTTSDANKDIGHYTQMVWQNTTLVGCGKAQCKGGQFFMSCSYAPGGNIGLEGQQFLRPYET